MNFHVSVALLLSVQQGAVIDYFKTFLFGHHYECVCVYDYHNE